MELLTAEGTTAQGLLVALGAALPLEVSENQYLRRSCNQPGALAGKPCLSPGQVLLSETRTELAGQLCSLLGKVSVWQ